MECDFSFDTLEKEIVKMGNKQLYPFCCTLYVFSMFSKVDIEKNIKEDKEKEIRV